MRAVSSGTDGTSCSRRSDMADLRTRKPSNAMAHHKAADFANGVRPFLLHWRLISLSGDLALRLAAAPERDQRVAAVLTRPGIRKDFFGQVHQAARQHQ